MLLARRALSSNCESNRLVSNCPWPHTVLFRTLCPDLSIFWHHVYAYFPQSRSDLAHASSCTWLPTNPTSSDKPCCVPSLTALSTSRNLSLTTHLLATGGLTARASHRVRPLQNTHIDLRVGTCLSLSHTKKRSYLARHLAFQILAPSGRTLVCLGHEAFFLHLFHRRDHILLVGSPPTLFQFNPIAHNAMMVPHRAKTQSF